MIADPSSGSMCPSTPLPIPDSRAGVGFVQALRAACGCEHSGEDRFDHRGRGAFSDQSIGRIEIVEAAGGSMSIVADGQRQPGPLVVFLQVRGTAAIRQGDQTAFLSQGDLCLLRGTRPLTLDQVGDFEAFVASAPEQEIATRFPLWRAALLIPLPSGSGVPAVFRDALLSLRRWSRSLGHSGREGLADAVVDLIGALICCAVPTNADCIQRSLHHQDRIKTFARLNLGNPDLSVELIAEAVGLSPRQIHRLFANEEMSVMRWVWVQRLEHCYRELMQDGSGQRSIGDIAYAWGFNDQAHFSRTFRKHFGVSPRSLRRRPHHPPASSS